MGYWTKEREDKLAKLVCEGLPYREIAKTLAGGCTPGMVCGKVDRLRRDKNYTLPLRDKTGAISRRDTSSNRLYAFKKHPNRTQERQARNLNRDAADAEWRAAMDRMNAEALERDDLISLADFGDEERGYENCRYIPGDPSKQAAFCGHRTVPGTAFCERHLRQCCVPVSSPYDLRPRLAQKAEAELADA